MFRLPRSSSSPSRREAVAKLRALDKSQAVIEFTPDGTVLGANENFLGAMGYTLDEVRGKHHGMFVEPAQRQSEDYRQFWAKLARGEHQAAQFKRITKDGKEVWIEASYNPVFGRGGKPVKVVKYATDITAQKTHSADLQGQIEAIGKAQAVIEFNLDGTILNANENFLAATGYTLDEVRGKHHGMFVEPAQRQSEGYRQFWARLARGEHEAGQFKRIAKGGKEVWIEASYNPIFDPNGKPFKVVKYATDITAQKMRFIDLQGQIEAIGKSQAVIEFNLDGTILNANENFLAAMGYMLDEVRGRHHGMFVEPAYRDSNEYRQFWAKLGRGEYESGQFKRIARGGKEIWIEASYNPILDLNGKPFKVVKYATDITAQKMRFMDLQGQIEAIGKSMAVIEFNLDGTILNANENFLAAMGYSLAEVRGKHHGMFVEPAQRQSEDYRQFWARLARGEYQAAQFKRIVKGGKEIWIEASYTPILDLNGKPFKVVKYASDITAQVALLADLKALIERNFSEIDGAIGRSAEQAKVAGATVHETTGNVQVMAASAEEMAASVREIANMMSRSNTATASAHARTSEADAAIRRLAETSASMSGIIALIRDIAGQINLLSLNATIESARAGEAGKGFAVVAGEVKNLARQAANATNQIAQEVEQLQAVSGQVVEALGGISQSIETVREYVSSTAIAIEQQSSVTEELSNRMQTTALSIGTINDSMGEISATVRQVAQAVDDTKTAAKGLVK